MKEGWEIKPLGDTVDVLDNLRKPITKRDRIEGEYPYYGATGILSYVDNYIFSEKLVLIGEDGAKWLSGDNTSFIVEGKYWVNNHAHVIRPFRKIILDEWIVYFLNFSDLTPFITGMTVPKLNQEKMRSIPIPLPPLPEQQHIVCILDRAFAAINKAKANAEENLKNAKELFDCALDNILYDKKWEVQTLGEVCEKVEYGTSSKAQRQGKLPVLRMGNLQNGRIDWESLKYSDNEEDNKQYLLKYNDVLFNRTNSPEWVGKTAIYKGEMPSIFAGYLIRIHRKENILDADYLNYYLNSKMALDYGKTVVISSVNQANINGTKLKTYPIPLPTFKQQEKIVRQLDAIRAETQKLEAVYQKKMDDLEELKKSILQKAFAGELSASASSNVSASNFIPLQKVEGISATDLQVGITALALQKHIEKNRQHSFHHVKAEKIVHLSEYILNIDLNRNPVKDAAGPNDFPHAKKVESRARKAGFYSVYKNGDYYDYKQGNSFNKVIQKAQKSLGAKADTLSQIIDILAPMSTQHAEVVATVYAAWNNLMLTKEKFSDEDIVTEARENWHEDKMSIERDKFFKTLNWMRKNELLIPKGNGKVVEIKDNKKK